MFICIFVFLMKYWLMQILFYYLMLKLYKEEKGGWKWDFDSKEYKTLTDPTGG